MNDNTHFIEVSNLNNSYVFYRNLLGVKAKKIKPDSVEFKSEGINLVLIESGDQVQKAKFHMEAEREETESTYHRVNRFMKISFGNSKTCEVVKSTFHVEDPDGHLWTVGKGSDIDTENCYII